MPDVAEKPEEEQSGLPQDETKSIRPASPELEEEPSEPRETRAPESEPIVSRSIPSTTSTKPPPVVPAPVYDPALFDPVKPASGVKPLSHALAAQHADIRLPLPWERTLTAHSPPPPQGPTAPSGVQIHNQGGDIHIGNISNISGSRITITNAGGSINIGHIGGPTPTSYLTPTIIGQVAPPISPYPMPAQPLRSPGTQPHSGVTQASAPSAPPQPSSPSSFLSAAAKSNSGPATTPPAASTSKLPDPQVALELLTNYREDGKVTEWNNLKSSIVTAIKTQDTAETKRAMAEKYADAINLHRDIKGLLGTINEYRDTHTRKQVDEILKEANKDIQSFRGPGRSF